jgi:hypothetical protein
MGGRRYNWKWQQLRAELVEEAFKAVAKCAQCGAPCVRGQAIDIDHDPPLKGLDDPALLDRGRCRPMHHACHSSHTAGEPDSDERGYETQFDETGYPVDPRHPANRVGGKPPHVPGK